MEIEMMDNLSAGAKLRVVGIGGGGNNALNNMIESGLQGVEFIAANTDIQALENSRARVQLQLGRNLTRGLGAGANPDVGRQAALEDRDKIKELLSNSDMVFVTAGLGGGTGTGGAPVVAEVAKEIGALTVAVVTKPFDFEGKRRKEMALRGVEELKKVVDTLIVIPNTRLMSLAPKNARFLDMLKTADEVLLYAVKGISDLIMAPGQINLDFADVRAVMSEMGVALMGTGQATGEDRAMKAAEAAISNPLLDDVKIDGARGVLVNITATQDMSIAEVAEASTFIQEAAHEDANIFWGTVIDDSMGDDIRITVIATGIGSEEEATAHPRDMRSVVNGANVDPSVVDHIEIARYARNMGGNLDPRGPSGGGSKKPSAYPLGDDDDYDVPTFLRRQAD
jgi:cell division protein FtsZ